MGVKELVAGGIVTIVIGGSAYTINKTEVVDNLAEDTGLSQQEAEQYVNSIDEDELVPYDELGQSYIDGGNEILSVANQIDCANYEYEWQSAALPCELGKDQMEELGSDQVALGNAYKKLDDSDASRADIQTVVSSLDEVNQDLDAEVVGKILTTSELDESKKANSYNKALLQSALEGN